MQRPPNLAARDCRVGFPRSLAGGIRIDDHYCIQRTVVRVDLLQVRLQHLQGRNCARSYGGRDFAGAGKDDLRRCAVLTGLSAFWLTFHRRSPAAAMSAIARIPAI